MEVDQLFIDVKDNFLSKEDLSFVRYYCHNAPYYYGEKDDTTQCTIITGMISEIYSFNCNSNPQELQRKILNIFEENIQREFNTVKDLILHRMYVNCFASSENPYFHIDSPMPTDVGYYTFLFYINDNDWTINDGGETQFYVNETLYGITPIDNRMICFDSSILHKATPFRNKHRFTIALKYAPR